MNQKAKRFQEYLEAKGITCFQTDEIAGDAMNTVVFRSHMDIGGQSLQTLVLADSTIYTVLRVLVMPGALTKENETAMRREVDAINGRYKIFKCYFAPNGDLVLDTVIPAPAGEIDGDMVFTLFDGIIRNLEKEYETIAALCRH